MFHPALTDIQKGMCELDRTSSPINNYFSRGIKQRAKKKKNFFFSLFPSQRFFDFKHLSVSVTRF